MTLASSFGTEPWVVDIALDLLCLSGAPPTPKGQLPPPPPMFAACFPPVAWFLCFFCLCREVHASVRALTLKNLAQAGIQASSHPLLSLFLAPLLRHGAVGLGGGRQLVRRLCPRLLGKWPRPTIHPRTHATPTCPVPLHTFHRSNEFSPAPVTAQTISPPADAVRLPGCRGPGVYTVRMGPTPAGSRPGCRCHGPFRLSLAIKGCTSSIRPRLSPRTVASLQVYAHVGLRKGSIPRPPSSMHRAGAFQCYPSSHTRVRHCDGSAQHAQHADNKEWRLGGPTRTSVHLPSPVRPHAHHPITLSPEPSPRTHVHVPLTRARPNPKGLIGRGALEVSHCCRPSDGYAASTHPPRVVCLVATTVAAQSPGGCHDRRGSSPVFPRPLPVSRGEACGGSCASVRPGFYCALRRFRLLPDPRIYPR